MSDLLVHVEKKIQLHLLRIETCAVYVATVAGPGDGGGQALELELPPTACQYECCDRDAPTS